MRTLGSRGERGDAAVEVVLAVPVLLFLIMLVIQMGLCFHGDTGRIATNAIRHCSGQTNRLDHRCRP